MRDGPPFGGRSDRGASEVIGFVLLISVMLLSVGVVASVGMTGIEETRDAAVANGGEFVIESIATGVSDVRRGSAGARTVPLSLGEASLGADPATTTITVETTAVSTGTTETITRTVRPLTFTSSDANVTYSATAIFRESRTHDGISVQRAPEFAIEPDDSPDDERSVVPLVATTHEGGPDQVSGDRRRVNLTERGREGHVVEDPTHVDVTIEIQTTERRAQAWTRSLNRETAAIDPCSRSGGTVTCTFETDEVVVTVVEIGFGFE